MLRRENQRTPYFDRSLIQRKEKQNNGLLHNGIFPGLPNWNRPKDGTQCYRVSFPWRCERCGKTLSFSGDVIVRQRGFPGELDLVFDHVLSCRCGMEYYSITIDENYARGIHLG